jgi:predicted RNA-binding Zn-ribbon protein involved in translation (DUF1610 family)
MTIEKRTLISPQDIIGMECECTHCHAKLLVAIKRVDGFPTMCPNCGKRWIGEEQPSSGEVAENIILSHFIGYLADLQARLGKKIRFEISGEVHLPHDANPQGKTPQ